MAALSPPSSVAEASVAASAAARIARWRPWIVEASTRFQVPEAWIVAVMRAESGGRTMLNGAPITSSAGAMGLMQLMPDTYREVARTHGLGPDPHDPRDNILAGAAYLSAMRARFGYPGAFAAYNAGPARFEAHLRTGKPLPAETQAYLAGLSKLPGSADLPPTILSGTQLFFTLSDWPSAAPGETSPPGLFVPLRSPGEGR